MDEVSRIVKAAADGPEAVREILPGLLGGDWPRCGREPERPWQLHALHRAPACSVVVAVFRGGARAPIHDHGTWAVIGIHRGRERETWFGRDADGGLHEERSFENAAGQVSVVPEGVIHTVEALGDQDAVSVHVYGTDIVAQERHEYDPVTRRVSVYRPPFE
ncbi:hypothetical protein ACQPZJ_24135 [Actinoplanes sp. CA-054009]